MPSIKGTDLATLREIVRKDGPELEAELLRQLSPPLRELYLSTNPTVWNPVELQAALYETAAPLLYPTAPNPVIAMHRVVSQLSYGGIYRTFIRVGDIEHIAKRAAVLWLQYYDTGDARAENISDHGVDFVVANFPELPRPLRDATTAHLYVLATFAGLTDVVVTPEWTNPDLWRWSLRWR